LVPLSISFVLGYHLDRKTKNGKNTTIVEALTTMSAGALAAVLASIINAGIINWPQIIPKMIFAVISASLLGGVIGTIIPNRYRGQMKKMARISLGNVNLKKVVQSSLEKFTERANNGDVTISSMIAADIPDLRLDQSKIRLAVDGLLSNALEFTPSEGEVTIKVGLLRQGDIQISIKDNGIGMSSYNLKAITDASPEMLRAAWRQIGEYPNAGLLQIRSIVEKHGGRFKLMSRQWEGTEVTIELPKESACPQQPSASESETLPQGTLEVAAA
jgi:light-regulated signal transduction histidine kinase (bacteriophytochrome)